MSVILQILSILFVVMWTARLARNKGRNVMAWAGVAAIPAVGLLDIFPEWITVFCMLPMLALVFIPGRRTVATDGGQDGVVTCPRCQHSHEPGPSFCTNCGWEMNRPYASVERPAGSMDPVEASTTAAAEGSPAPETVAQDPAPATDPTLEPVMASTQSDNTETEAISRHTEGDEQAAAFAAAPLKITRPLTAAGMTDLGLSLFNQGRVREAVDQFTKAIALDPKYREAWANRAKAYNQLGLSEKEAADRAQLEAI